jgi:uncharacterized alkaline shock family protein YloU
MAESRKSTQIKSDQLGEVRVADEVIAIIAGLAATEVEGVSSMAGNITNEIVSRLGMKNLSKGITVDVTEESIKVNVAINIAYGYSIPDVSAKVQERVCTAIENMTGLKVESVDVQIASVDMANQ